VAKKAWFMFDKGFVALGNNINASAPGDVYTSVNQFLLNGSVLVKSGGNTQVIAKESNTLIDGCQWVLHDGIGYVFPSGQDVYIENREKVGRWSDINSGRSSATLSKDVFGLYINHRNMPVNQSYEYFVLPDMEQKELAAYATNPNITIISNTDRQQALWNKTQNVLGSVFWSSGDVEIPTTITGLEESLSISADKPCMVLLRKTGDSQWSLSVSNPENKAMSLNIKINRLLTGDGTYQDNGSTIIPFTIPEGDYAGQSITKMLKSDTTKEVV
jgi:chondroitin AC lyase